MPRNSIITEGFTSNSTALVTEGWADLQEIAIVGAGTLLISGVAITQRVIENYFYYPAGDQLIVSGSAPRILELGYSGNGEILVDGVAESAIEFSYTPTGQELLLSGLPQYEVIIANIYYPSGEIITIEGTANVSLSDFSYITTAKGQIVLEGTATSTIGFSFTPTGEELFLDGISRTLFTIEQSYFGDGKIELSGTSTSQLGLFYLPTGEIITLDGNANTYIHDLHFEFDPITGKIIVSGLATTKFSKFLEFKKPLEPEDVFNYASGYKDPQFQEEIRGGRAVSFLDKIVTRSDWDSKKKIQGIPNFGKKYVNRDDRNSRDKVKGVPIFTKRKSNKKDFDGE